jgi:integrase
MTHQSQKRASRTVLTVTKIEAMRPKARRYEITDAVARGLQLRVERSGRKVWLHRYTWNEKTIRLTLGPYPRLSLIEARAKVNKNQEWLNEGIEPRRAEPRGSRARRGPFPIPPVSPLPLLPGPTEAGSSCVQSEVLPPNWPTDRRSLQLLEALTPRPRDEHSLEFMVYEFFLLFIAVERKNPSEVARVLRTEVLVFWKGRDARTITPREIIERLDGIVKRGARVMANRAAAILRQLFLHGVHRSTIGSSPVQLLFRPGGKESSGMRALSEEEITLFLVHRFEACSSERLARILTIYLLTAARRVELVLAKWEHIDFENATWLIPAENTKSDRALLLPLTRFVLEEFRALKRLSLGSIYVLPRRALDAPVHPNVITRATQRSQCRFQLFGIAPFTPHDLRRSCRTGLGRIGVRRFIARRVLNHKQPGMDGVYDLHDYFTEKRKALRRWTNHVVHLHSCASTPQPPGAPAMSNTAAEPLLLPSREIAGPWVNHRLTREELHRLVWSTPMRLLCKEFVVSNVWLAKICTRYEIPVPGRGYWAKKRSGAAIAVSRLKAASLGIPEFVDIRGGAPARLQKLSDRQVGSGTPHGKFDVEDPVSETSAGTKGGTPSVPRAVPPSEAGSAKCENRKGLARQ